MVVPLIDGFDRNEFVTLVSRLEAEPFADGCVIGKVAQRMGSDLTFDIKLSSSYGIQIK